jgi:hypothetical protein
MATRRCKATKRDGTRCTRKPVAGSKYCSQAAHQAHASIEVEKPQVKPRRRPSGPRRKQEQDWRPRFLEAFETELTVIGACRAVGVAKSTVYKERQENGEFAAAFGDVEDTIVQLMEREAHRRGVEGWIKRERFEVGENGERVLIDQTIEHSDTLLMFLLKARRPDTYRERHQIEHTGPSGGPLEHQIKVTDLTTLTDEQLAAFEALHGDAGSAEQS